MATSSFSKSFQIEKQETIDQLEKAINKIVPISSDIEKVMKNRK